MNGKHRHETKTDRFCCCCCLLFRPVFSTSSVGRQRRQDAEDVAQRQRRVGLLGLQTYQLVGHVVDAPAQRSRHLQHRRLRFAKAQSASSGRRPQMASV